MHSTTQTYHYYYSTATIKLAKKELNKLAPQNLLDGNLKIKPTTDRAYKYKYQGQERQEELNLNWDSFKWRNYDYAIGRFMSVDPLAEKYTYNSTYAFQENKMGLGRELEGLELAPFYVNFNMSFTDNIKANYHAQKTFITTIASDVLNTGETMVNPIKMYQSQKAAITALASPIKTITTISNSVKKTVTDLGSSNPKTAGEAYGKIAAFIAETAVGAEAVGAEAASVEVVQRAMSGAELSATIETGLVRGGREGTHFVSDAVNNTAKSAQKRLALPTTPEVKATLEVPKGTFSKPTKVKPAFNQPGGGMERTGSGNIPAKIIKVKEYKK